MGDIHIRPYRVEDWAAIVRIHDRARRVELSLAGLDEAFIPLEQAAVNEGLFNNTLLVAELDGESAGFAAYNEEELAWLYVLPEKRRCGVGEALTQAVLLQNPSRPLHVEVLLGNEPARRLYEKCGFLLTETATGHMPGNESFEVSAWCLALK